MDGRLLGHATEGEGDVEGLIALRSGIVEHVGQPFGEWQVRAGGGDRARGVPLRGQRVEQRFILGDDRVEVSGNVEQILDDEIALLVELIKVYSDCASHKVLL